MLPIHLIVAADVEQDYLLRVDAKLQGDAVGVSNSDSMVSFKLTVKGMQPKRWLGRIGL